MSTYTFQLYPSPEHPEEKSVRKLAWVLAKIAEAEPNATLAGADTLRINVEREPTAAEAQTARLAEARQIIGTLGLKKPVEQQLLALLT